jgi:hypothetical protein
VDITGATFQISDSSDDRQILYIVAISKMEDLAIAAMGERVLFCTPQ